MSNYVLDPEIREAAKLYDFRDQGKSLLIICKDHGDKLTGEECPYCRIAALEKERDNLASTVRILGIEVDGRMPRIAALEKVAEVVIDTLAPDSIPDHELSLAIRVIRKPIIKALREAGYGGGE